LPRSNKECPVCKGGEAVFFQSQQRSAETGMKLFYVCCDCGHIFQ
ncbi:DNA-directed RNA polymerase subunit, partial [Colletotrichum higginsianum]